MKRGKYGGTYAHKDIAFEFASAISPVFKLYLIKEFQRLKEAENDVRKMEWDAKKDFYPGTIIIHCFNVNDGPIVLFLKWKNDGVVTYKKECKLVKK